MLNIHIYKKNEECLAEFVCTDETKLYDVRRLASLWAKQPLGNVALFKHKFSNEPLMDDIVALYMTQKDGDIIKMYVDAPYGLDDHPIRHNAALELRNSAINRYFA